MEQTATRNTDELLHHLIEQQVDATPDRCAVTYRGTDLSYAELDGWANRLAHRLQRAGVGTETRVAVIADRRAETVVALLAVLKAGGVYVPIDPANPPRRVQHLMADSGVSVLITPAELTGAAPVGAWTVVRSDPEHLADQPASRPRSKATAGNAAYVIYTSGSTGEPKGVTVVHRQVVRTTLAQLDLGRPAPVSFLLLVGFSFDASAVGLYWTLATGGRLVVPSPAEHEDPLALRELVARHRVTHLDCTPSLYSLIHADDAGPLASLQCVIVGGEACPRALVERHYTLLPECLLINNYGPTETTIWTATTTLTQGGPDATVPIGFPIHGAELRVLDEHLVPVDDGEVGELFVGGPGVARGYHGRPGLTGERFLPDPWTTVPGVRMYRTGDRARMLPDGQLEFLGRVDHQVKLRGYRIELAEVEQALASHRAVTDAVADVRTIGGTQTLVGWVSGADDRAADPAEVRSQVADRLPAYMVPDTVVVLDELPRNLAGKLDRSRLPSPKLADGGISGRELTTLEAEVAHLVTQILGRERIGATDSFFDVGANSLHLAQLALAVRAGFSVGVPIHQLFEVPNVAGVARMIDAARRRQRLQAMGTAEVLAETVLDDSIRPAADLPHANWTAPANILLTGATGYLGAFLLKELMERTDATIWCLVRAGSAGDAKDRIRTVMRAYFAWDDAFDGRIVPVVGDLGEPLLGLEPSGFGKLGQVIDAIYHCGALVNFVYPYSQLRRVNVDSVAEVLRLGVTGRLKAVHYVSSIDVFLHTGRQRPYLEDEEFVPHAAPEAYARSKWAGDHLVRIGRARGIPTAIYRPGMLMSQTETGATQTTDYMLLQIKGLLELGITPDLDHRFDAIPVDYAAQAIAHISLQAESIGRNFHLWNQNPVPITEVHGWVRSFGYTFETVPLEEAKQRLLTLGPDNPMFPLLPLQFEVRNDSVLAAFSAEALSRTNLYEECQNTLNTLAGTGIECPLMTLELAHKCFSYLVDIGFLPEPQQQRARFEDRAGAGRAPS